MKLLLNLLLLITLIILTLINDKALIFTHMSTYTLWLSVFYMVCFTLGAEELAYVWVIFVATILFDCVNHITLGFSTSVVLAALLIHVLVNSIISLGTLARIILGSVGNVILISITLKVASHFGHIYVGNVLYFTIVNLALFAIIYAIVTVSRAFAAHAV